MSCGIVLEESRIVAEVQFLETAGGGHQVSGKKGGCNQLQNGFVSRRFIILIYHP